MTPRAENEYSTLLLCEKLSLPPRSAGCLRRLRNWNSCLIPGGAQPPDCPACSSSQGASEFLLCFKQLTTFSWSDSDSDTENYVERKKKNKKQVAQRALISSLLGGQRLATFYYSLFFCKIKVIFLKRCEAHQARFLSTHVWEFSKRNYACFCFSLFAVEEDFYIFLFGDLSKILCSLLRPNITRNFHWRWTGHVAPHRSHLPACKCARSVVRTLMQYTSRVYEYAWKNHLMKASKPF